MKKDKNSLRIVTITLFVLICCTKHVCAFDLDMTVEDDIRKNYNSSKLVNDTKTEDYETLPELPQNLKNNSYEAKNNAKSSYTSPAPQVSPIYGNVKISKGTSFNVVSTGKISDWQTRGAKVKFKTNSIINKRGYTIPSGTVFTGEITESHQPQISCNGGLVVIRIRSMLYKGKTIPLNAYITRADDKMIFFNDIKGKRTYLKTVWKKGSWGRALFNRMVKLTANLGKDGSTLLSSPFPFLYGTLCLGANTVISPVTAFFQKGGHVSIPQGSRFRIKLLDDTYID